MAKEKLVLSLDADIKRKLKQYADEKHMTMSAAITAWVLTLKLNGIPGQMSLRV